MKLPRKPYIVHRDGRVSHRATGRPLGSVGQHDCVGTGLHLAWSCWSPFSGPDDDVDAVGNTRTTREEVIEHELLDPYNHKPGHRSSDREIRELGRVACIARSRRLYAREWAHFYWLLRIWIETHPWIYD